MKQFFDDFTGTVLTSRGGVRFENGVLIKERIMETENRGRKPHKEQSHESKLQQVGTMAEDSVSGPQ